MSSLSGIPVEKKGSPYYHAGMRRKTTPRQGLKTAQKRPKTARCHDLTLREYLDARWGTRSAVARVMGVTPTTITDWLKDGVPAERVLTLEAVTGVRRWRIRPDIYPPPAAPTPVSRMGLVA